MVTRRQLRGAEVFAAQLSEALAGRGHRVVLAALYAPGEPPLEPFGVELLDLGGRPRAGLSPGLLGATAAFLRSCRPHVVQANGSDTLKYLALAGRLVHPRPPLVYRNISMASAWLRGPLHRRWNRWLAGRADAVAAVSSASGRDYAATHRYPVERIETIPIGTPVPERLDREGARRHLAELLELPPDVPTGPIVLHAGSFTPEKDHAGLLEAFAQVVPRHPSARLVLAGDGPLREEIASSARRLGLMDRLHLAGARADLGDWLAGGDLLVLSSRVEGVPGVVLEAAARELPVVATAVGGVADAVLDGETGFLVPPGDPRALAAALDRLLEDAPLRERMGRAGRDHVLRHFALPAVVDRFERLYRRLAGGPLA